MYNLESHDQTATRPLTVTARQELQVGLGTGHRMLRPGQTANRNHLPYFSLVARRNWRITSRELRSIVPSW